jgi:uncharacterized membrane protein YfhO
VDASFAGINIQSHRFIYYIPIPLSLASAQVVKRFLGRLSSFSYRLLAYGLVALVVVSSLAFGNYGVQNMVSKNPFVGAAKEDKEVADYLNKNADPFDIITIQASYHKEWFNVFTNLTQALCPEPQAIANKNLAYNLTIALAEKDVFRVRAIMEGIGSRYIIVDANSVEDFRKVGFNVVFQTSNPVNIYKTYILKLNTTEPAFIRTDGNILFFKRITDQVTFTTNGTETIVVRTSFNRWWHAYIDGLSSQIEPDEYGFIKLKLSTEGILTVTLSYYSPERDVAAYITILSSAFLSVFAIAVTLWKVPNGWGHTVHKKTNILSENLVSV